MSEIWLPHTRHERLQILDHGLRGSTKGVVIHGTQSASLEGTVSYFRSGSGGGDRRGVGAQLIIDNHKAVQLVPLDHKAWHAVEANGFAIGIEQVSFATWTRSEWLKHDTLLTLVANRIAWICHEWELGRPRRHHNVWAHSDGGAAWGGHACPGAHYPWDVVMKKAVHAYNTHWGR